MYINKRGIREIGNVLFKKPTPGRLVTTAWIAPIYLGLRQTASLFRTLDEVLHPEYREQTVERPVFVLTTGPNTSPPASSTHSRSPSSMKFAASRSLWP